MGMAYTTVIPAKKCGDPHPTSPHLVWCSQLGGWATPNVLTSGELRYGFHLEGDTSGKFYDYGGFYCAAHEQHERDAR